MLGPGLLRVAVWETAYVVVVLITGAIVLGVHNLGALAFRSRMPKKVEGPLAFIGKCIFWIALIWVLGYIGWEIAIAAYNPNPSFDP